MIPKIIHCVWLSGEEKPSIYLNCIQTWKNIMPDYEIKEWSLANLPEEVINHIFVSSAIREKKMGICNRLHSCMGALQLWWNIHGYGCYDIQKA